MKPRFVRHCFSETEGQSLIEFSLSAFLCVMLLLGMVDIGRMVLVYTTVSNSARVGVRYAMVHGSDNPATATQIKAIVNNYLAAGSIQTAAQNITISYPDSNSTLPGARVQVTVTYPYQPLTSYFPLSVTLGTTSQGVITF